MDGPFHLAEADTLMEPLAAVILDFRIGGELVASFRPGVGGGGFDEPCRHVLLPRGFDDINPF